MSGSALIVVAYALLAVFAVVFVIRTISIARLPVHLRWELAPVPHEKGKGHYGGSYFEEYEWWTKPREKSYVSEMVYMFKEIVFLKGVWEHNRRLWWWSFPFHFGLYLLIVAAPVLALRMALGAGGSASGIDAQLGTTVSALAGAGFGLGAVGALGLLANRLFDVRLKPFTTPMSLFNLVLLLAVFASGGLAMGAAGEFPAAASGAVTALLTANMSPILPGALVAHLLCTLLFLAYLPFSQMMHFVAKYFTYHQVRWDDKPLAVGGRVEKEVLELLGQKVTWSGAHLKADGKKNWVDIATEGKGQ
jgi:nitrate reductase gamma subunit